MKTSLPATKEVDIQKAIIGYLLMKGHFVWRNNTGGRPWTDSRGSKRIMMFGKKGSSDIIGCLRDGRFLAIEVKRPGEVPRPDQLEFLAEINSRGGLAFIAYSIEDVLRHTI